MALVYTDRIVELGKTPSTGTVGDSFHNTLVEAVNGLYKTELIRKQGPRRTVAQVEMSTLEYVWWWNSQRLHRELAKHDFPTHLLGTKRRANQPPRRWSSRVIYNYHWVDPISG